MNNENSTQKFSIFVHPHENCWYFIVRKFGENENKMANGFTGRKMLIDVKSSVTYSHN